MRGLVLVLVGGTSSGEASTAPNRIVMQRGQAPGPRSSPHPPPVPTGREPTCSVLTSFGWQSSFRNASQCFPVYHLVHIKCNGSSVTMSMLHYYRYITSIVLRTISMKSGLMLAPPTSAPSISGRATNSAIFSEVTLPP